VSKEQNKKARFYLYFSTIGAAYGGKISKIENKIFHFNFFLA